MAQWQVVQPALQHLLQQVSQTTQQLLLNRQSGEFEKNVVHEKARLESWANDCSAHTNLELHIFQEMSYQY